MPYTLRSIALHGASCPEPLPAPPTAACVSSNHAKARRPIRECALTVVQNATAMPRQALLHRHRSAVEIICPGRHNTSSDQRVKTVGMNVNQSQSGRRIVWSPACLSPSIATAFALGNSMKSTRSCLTRDQRYSMFSIGNPRALIATPGVTTEGRSTARPTALQPNRGECFPLSTVFSVVSLKPLPFGIRWCTTAGRRVSKRHALLDVFRGVTS